jgi:excisionase family DNA binding protein
MKRTHPMTTFEAAEILGVSVERVRQLIQEGQLPAVRLGKRTYQIWDKDVQILKKSRRSY